MNADIAAIALSVVIPLMVLIAPLLLGTLEHRLLATPTDAEQLRRS